MATIKTWQERAMAYPKTWKGRPDKSEFMAQEIAELRAALSNRPTAEKAGGQSMDHFVSAIMGKLDEYGMAVRDDNDDWRSRVRGEIFNALYDRPTAADAAPAANAAHQDADELRFNATRLRNVAKLVGLGSAVPEDDATLDGARGSVLGMISGALRNANRATAVIAAPAANAGGQKGGDA